jgi:site-specific recombinase XerD
VREFFEHYLPHLKNVSPNTVQSYRDTFTIFLPFVADRLSIPVKKIEVHHISAQLIAAFLHHLHKHRNNSARTVNARLATLKSLAKMIRLLHPECDDTAKTILRIPQQRYQKRLVGYLSYEEILKVLASVDLKRKDGFRDYCLLHLLFDSGARAAEVVTLTLDSCDLRKRTLAIVGKGNRYRVIELWPKTVDLIGRYIERYRRKPKPAYRTILFVNQRGEAFTRYGINALGQKYLAKVLSAKERINLSPAHSFRHSCAVNMLLQGEQPTTIKNRLGHEDLKSTMVYLKLNLSARKEVQRRFIEHTQSRLTLDPKIDELIDWENKEDVLSWLDTL